MIIQSRRPDHVFSCARLAWELSDSDINRQKLLSIVESRYQDGFLPDRDDGTIKTLAILFELDGKHEDSERLLNDAIGYDEHKEDSFHNNQRYFFKSMLAQIYLNRNDDHFIYKAIKLLKEISVEDAIGEANFFLAKAYLKIREIGNSKRYLKAAANARKKWLIKASYISEFNNQPELTELLSEYAADAY